MVKIREQFKEMFIDFFPNKLIDHYSFVNNMSLILCPIKKKQILMPLEWGILRFFLFLSLFICLTGSASAVDIPAGHVSNYSLNSAGTTYVLTGNILTNTNAFFIAANDITLDGNGYKIDCGFTSEGVGLTCNNHRNFTLKNVRVVQHNLSKLSDGIRVQNSVNVLISNCSASSIAGSGIYVTGSIATIDRCETSSNRGISLNMAADNSRIIGCSAVSDSNNAISLTNANNNIMSNCTGHSNTGCGIDFKNSTSNNVSNCAGYSNTNHGLSFIRCKNNSVRASIGHTNSSTEGFGISLTDSSKNTFVDSVGLSRLDYGIKLIGSTTYNTFVNCVGESFGQDSLWHGIWFSYSSFACSGTNTFKNVTSRSTLATTNKDPSKVTCLSMGDSITTGGHAGLPYGAYIHYANIKLGNNYVFYNRALGGETSEGGKIRFLDEMAVFNPEYVTIMYGANDLKDKRSQQTIINDILWMASQAKAQGAIPIILLTSTRRGFEDETTALDKNLSSQAIKAGYHVFNVYDIIDTVPNNDKYDAFNSTNCVDSVHPTQAANKLIGDKFAKYFQSLSGKENVKPSAKYSANVRSGYAPLRVQFTDLSENAIERKWNFGDGTSSTAINPAHIYSKAGKYTVSLTVKNKTGSDKVTKSNFIVVNAPKAPVAAFSASPLSGKAPLTVTFTDKSTNTPTSWYWRFGDGSTSSVQKPSHKYTKAGTYTISLTVKNYGGNSSITKSKYIKIK